jgi:COP9 signalosome complex subunit 6
VCCPPSLSPLPPACPHIFSDLTPLHTHTHARVTVIEVFPNYEILGWYSTGRTVTQGDLATHQRMGDLNENPLFLTFDTAEAEEDEETLPIKVLESSVTGSGETVFVELPYTIDTLEPERICVDHIASQKRATVGAAITEHSKSLTAALQTLRERIETIKRFLVDVRAGRVQNPPASLMRQVAGLCNRLPVGSSADFQAALLQEANDTALITYLSEVTKIAVAVQHAKLKNELTFEQDTVGDRRNLLNVIGPGGMGSSVDAWEQGAGSRRGMYGRGGGGRRGMH